MNIGLDNNQLKVFLCHGNEDKAKVRELYSRLRKDGVAPWFDEEDLIPGQDWDMEIRKAVRASHAIIVCLSKKSVNKEGYYQKEIKFALDVADQKPEGAIFIIPVRLEECDLLFRLVHWQWVDYFDEGGYEKIIRALRKRANDIGISIIPGDGKIERVLKPIEESSGRLLYKSVVIREILKQARDGVLSVKDADILPSDKVVGITHEALIEALKPFEHESRRLEEMERLLRFVGIQKPYQEWEEKINKIQCFRNEANAQMQTDSISRIPVSSSNVASIGYDAERKILEVAFHNRSIYRYFDVPEYLHRGLLSANSHGSFLNAHIKSANFAYEKVE